MAKAQKAKSTAKAAAKKVAPKPTKASAKASKPVQKKAAAKGSEKVKKVAEKSVSKAVKAVEKAPSPKSQKVVIPKPVEKPLKTPKAPAEVTPKPSVMSARPSPASEEAAVEVAAAPDIKMVEGKKAKKEKDWSQIDRAGDIEAQWAKIHEACRALKASNYKMSENYEARTPIIHKVLGWGYVLTSQNNRLEVIFKDGIKVLIANYKA